MTARDSRKLAAKRARGWREAIDYAQHIGTIMLTEAPRLDRMADMIERTGLSWEELQSKNPEGT